MKKFLFSAFAAFAMLASSSCTKDEIPETFTDAQEQGRADAKSLSNAHYTADRDLHAALLAVKSREFEMRLSGDSLNATAYIEAFKSHLKEIDHDLAKKVL